MKYGVPCPSASVRLSKSRGRQSRQKGRNGAEQIAHDQNWTAKTRKTGEERKEDEEGRAAPREANSRVGETREKREENRMKSAHQSSASLAAASSFEEVLVNLRSVEFNSEFPALLPENIRNFGRVRRIRQSQIHPCPRARISGVNQE